MSRNLDLPRPASNRIARAAAVLVVTAAVAAGWMSGAGSPSAAASPDPESASAAPLPADLPTAANVSSSGGAVATNASIRDAGAADAASTEPDDPAVGLTGVTGASTAAPVERPTTDVRVVQPAAAHVQTVAEGDAASPTSVPSSVSRAVTPTPASIDPLASSSTIESEVGPSETAAPSVGQSPADSTTTVHAAVTETTAPPVRSPDTESDTDSTCSVSELLVPECGAWLGASTPSDDGKYDYTQGLAEYEAVAQNVPDILHFFRRGATTFPNAEEVALAHQPGRQPSLMYFNWKPSLTLSWRQIADGQADDNIRMVAEGLQRYPGKLFLTIHHEPENDQGNAGSGRTPEDYVDMFRHVVQTLRAEGVTNAVYVMNFMGFSGWASVADEFYPGDDVVDWIAYDPYAHANQPTFAHLLNLPNGDWPGFYEWAVARAPGKPIMLGEWGFDIANQPRSPQALDGAAETLEQRFPEVKAIVYWNDRTEEYDYRLDQPTELGREYGKAYAQLASDPYFNSTSTDGRIELPEPQPVARPGRATVPPADGALEPPAEIPEFPAPVVAIGSAVALAALVMTRRRRHSRAY